MVWSDHLVVGLTGGIGCGKTTVALLFAKLGARIVDTDEISHDLTQANSPTTNEIVDAFGIEFLSPNGELDRKKLRDLVYSDPAQRLKLEAILHPQILQSCQQQLEQLSSARYTLLCVPLLFEKPVFSKLIHRSLVVDCEREEQISRVISRSQLNRAQVEAILKVQLSREDRLKMANDVITNSGLVENLPDQVHRLHRIYTNWTRQHK